MIKRKKIDGPLVYPGDQITYVDRHERWNLGRVITVTCDWYIGLEKGDAQGGYYTYTVQHPSYKNRKIGICEEDIKEIHGKGKR